MNENFENMLAELKREFHEIYEVPYNGLYVIISDSYGKTTDKDRIARFDLLNDNVIGYAVDEELNKF